MIFSRETLYKINKAKGIANKLVAKAKKERDSTGYRENLGYDSRAKLEEGVAKFNLGYVEMCEVYDFFNSQCDKI